MHGPQIRILDNQTSALLEVWSYSCKGCDWVRKILTDIGIKDEIGLTVMMFLQPLNPIEGEPIVIRVSNIATCHTRSFLGTHPDLVDWEEGKALKAKAHCRPCESQTAPLR